MSDKKRIKIIVKDAPEEELPQDVKDAAKKWLRPDLYDEESDWAYMEQVDEDMEHQRQAIERLEP